MLAGLSYEFELRRFQRQKERTRKRFKKLLDEAREQKKDQLEVETIAYNEVTVIEYIDDEIAQLQSRYLFRQAEKYLIPWPERKTDDGAWEESDFTGRWRLTPHALSELRTAVRQEKKVRREFWQTWLILLTGFMGTLIGVLAVLNSN